MCSIIIFKLLTKTNRPTGARSYSCPRYEVCAFIRAKTGDGGAEVNIWDPRDDTKFKIDIEGREAQAI